MAGGNAFKIGIIVIGLGFAAFMFMRSGEEPESQLAAGATGMRECVCTGCGHHWQCPDAEYQAALQEAPEPPPPSSDAPRTRKSPVPIKLVKCPECNEFAATLGSKCKDSDTWYPARNPDGTRGSCPD